MRLPALLRAAALSTALLVSIDASAQATGFALNRFDPSDRGSEWFTTSSLDFRGTRPAFGVVMDWAHKPLVIYDANGKENTVLVGNQITAHVGSRITFGDRFVFGLSMPWVVYAQGEDGVSNGVTYLAPRADPGDMRLSGDFLLVGKYGSPFSLSGGAALYVPSGSKRGYTGDENVRVAPRMMAAGDIGPIAYSARLGILVRPLDDSFGRDTRLGSELVGGVALGARLADKKLLIGPELYTSTVFTNADSFFGKRTTPVEGLFGAHYKFGEFQIGAGVGPGLTRAFGTPAVRTLLSLEWVPEPDSDMDGIRDPEDACPGVAGVPNIDPKKHGCPPPPPPPPPRREPPPAPSDRDGDKIPDATDACPDVAGVPNDDPKKHGCPPDRDGDGIPDAEDACIDVPGVKSDDPKKNGCPPDTDGDGIVDPEDACPKDPGPKDPDPKKNGCPVARIEAGQIKITQQVKFKFNSAEILKESDPILEAVLKILNEHPEITKIRVEGHTDNAGKAAYNKGLSERRAASVAKWLTGKGVDKKRLASQGHGMDRPIDTNATEEGRTNNRRVEFHIEGGAAAPASEPTNEGKKQ